MFCGQRNGYLHLYMSACVSYVHDMDLRNSWKVLEFGTRNFQAWEELETDRKWPMFIILIFHTDIVLISYYYCYCYLVNWGSQFNFIKWLTGWLTDAFIFSFNHLFIHSFIHSFYHACIYLFIHSFIHSLIHSCMHLFIYLFIHSFIHAFINS